MSNSTSSPKRLSKEEVLVRPFQIRRYIQHRHKVAAASPAIDNQMPLERNHVTVKLKKQLWEKERKERIKQENFRLLQRLGQIMQINRLDNWYKKRTNKK